MLAREASNIHTTSEMIHHRGASLSEQHTADLLICHGTQQDLSLSTVTGKHNKSNLMMHK